MRMGRRRSPATDCWRAKGETSEAQETAARGGLREGDVIEMIDGRPIGRGAWTFGFPFNRQKKHVVSLVREREKKQIVLEAVD